MRTLFLSACTVVTLVSSLFYAQKGLASQGTDPAVARGPDGKQLVLTHSHGGKKFVVALPAAMEKTKELRTRPNGRVLVLGESVGDTIATVDAERVTAKVHGYGAAISPTARYVAFERFYPRNAPSTLATAVYEVFDVDNVRTLKVYPDDSTEHVRLSGPVWVDESVVSFVDADGERANVVAVSLADGKVSRVEVKALDTAALVDAKYFDNNAKLHLALAGAHLERVPGPPGDLTLRLTFPREIGLKVRHIDVLVWKQ